jgi:molybdopterin/thiamine biosynthesis adenylyltransferase/rhodanese-related sulfurtransferase
VAAEVAVDEASVDEVASWLQQSPALVVLDVRETDEHAAGIVAGALCLPRALIATHIAKLVPDKQRLIVAYCGSGVRSQLASQALADLGYSRVCSMRGGFAEWQRAGHAWVVPAGDADGRAAPLTAEQTTRYARHVRLPEIGVAGQRRLLAARVLCVGAGGLGSPAGLYLAAAGIGTLGIVDSDVVELSNLQRQVLHASDRLGMPKVDSAGQTLRALNPDVRVIRIAERLGAANALAILADYDLIVDGSDNFATRYLINDAALRLRKPVIHAAIQRFEGQLTAFAADGAPCYRCLFPQPPPADTAPSCAEAGVLGTLPGVLGVLQATEAIKQILGIGRGLVGRLVTYDALAMSFTELRLQRDPHCPTCGEGVDRSAIQPRDQAPDCSAA